MITYRKYQEDEVKKVLEFFGSDKTVPSVVVSPVASGKSIIIGGAASQLTDPTLVLQPSKELLEQNYAKLLKFGGKASLYSASVNSREIGHTTYATLGSIKKVASEFKKVGVKNVIIDECFPYNTFVSTTKGNKRIGYIHKQIQEGKDVFVKSFNELSKTCEYKKVLGSRNNGSKDVYKVNFYGKKSIRCTQNHPFLTVTGDWKKVEELQEGDALLTSGYSDSNNSFLQTLNQDQLQIVFGSELGDGYIEYKYPHQGRLKIIHGESQQDYLNWKNSKLFDNVIEHVEENGYSKKDAYRLQTKQFYFPYSDYATIIDNLNLLGLSILWLDDGNLSKLENSGTLYALCTDLESLTRLNTKINTLCNINGSIKETRSSSSGRVLHYISYKKDDVLKLTGLISKYVPECMKYKIPKMHWDKLSTYKFDTTTSESVVVFKEKALISKEDVYDLEVEDNHNFIVCSQDNSEGLIAHNCHMGYSPKEDSMFRKFMAELNPKNVLGFTATPVRLKQYGGLGGDNWSQLNMINRTNPVYFKEILDVVPISLMVEKGYWSPLMYEQYDFDESKLRLNSTKAEFTESSIKRALLEQGVNNNVYLRVKTLLQQGRSNILVFTDSVETAHILASKFPNISACIDGKTNKKKRTKIIEEFKDGHIKIVFNFGTLTTGFDHEELDTVILGRPTNSLALYYQMVGRGTRIHENKIDCLVVDFCNNVKRFGRLESLNFKNVEGYGWGMFNSDSLLTGIPMGTKVSLKEIEAKAKRKLEDRQDFTLPFGKYKGRKLSTIPLDYRNWLLANAEGFNLNGISTKKFKEQLLDLLEEEAVVDFDSKRIVVVDLNNISFKLFKNRKLNAKGMEEYRDKLARKFNTSNVVIVNDSSKSSYWRKELYPDYKVRKARDLDENYFEGLTDILKNVDVKTVRGMEADDLISDYVRDNSYEEVIVVSKDGDFKQLALFNRCTLFDPFAEKEMKVNKKEAVKVLLTKILKGDAKDNVKKSHNQGRILTKDLDKVAVEVYADIVSYVKANNIRNIEDVDLKTIFYTHLSTNFDMDKEKFDLNFKLLNLIQKQYESLQIS